VCEKFKQESAGYDKICVGVQMYDISSPKEVGQGNIGIELWK
jgi:hypothetical protein